MSKLHRDRDGESPLFHVNKLQPLQFTGLVMVLKILSEANKETISVANFFKLGATDLLL